MSAVPSLKRPLPGSLLIRLSSSSIFSVLRTRESPPLSREIVAQRLLDALPLNFLKFAQVRFSRAVLSRPPSPPPIPPPVMGGTWVALAAIEFLFLGAFTGWLLWFYAAKGTHWSAWVVVFVSWYLGFFGTMFLPIDVAEAYYPTENNQTIVSRRGRCSLRDHATYTLLSPTCVRPFSVVCH
jgi:hypothetical protein